jgi:cytochrome c-type biogenesis protein CcmF
LGRANGGMVVHIGVIMIAVALAASNSYTHSQEIELKQGSVATFSGHTFELTGFSTETNARRTVVAAIVKVDGGKSYSPAITKFKSMGTNIGTPSVKSTFVNDIYLTIEPPVKMSSKSAKIKVFIKPMVMWLWIGGGLMGIGTLLAAFPGRRRKPTDATSALVPEKVDA